MTETDSAATGDNQNDLSTLPASAFPPGVDPASYVASLTGEKTETKEAPTRPEHVPEKFWDAEKGAVRVDDVLKSYLELEKRQGAAKTDDKPSLKIESQSEESESGNALTTAFEAFAQTYEANAGAVGEDDIAKIAALGVPPAMIQTYLAGLEALAQQSFSQAYAVAGGEETFNAAADWAGKNLTAAEVESYNRMVSDASTMKAGVEWLVSKYKSATPSEGSFIQAEAGAPTGDVFRSKAEMTAAIQDPRYKSDPAFRQDVADKFARSRAAGSL